MARRRRKQIKCLNCETPLKEPYNFCPNCGQENNDNNISFAALYKDFWSNYLSLDSRFGRTIKPFFTKPGFITLDFISGKRVKFANPVRLYLLISFIHFFFFFKYSAEREDVPAVVNFSSDNDSTSLESLESLSNIPDSLQNNSSYISTEQFALMVRMNQLGNYTVDEVYDSLNVSDTKSWFAKRSVRQLIKINRLSNIELNLYIYRQIPLGMFFILPVVALLLKLFHRKRLYILHVVHSLHLHSFALFIMGTCWAFLWLLNSENQNVIFSGLIISGIYCIISFKRVYSHGWPKTLIKFMGTLLLYMFTLIVAVSVLAVVSLFFY